MKTISRTVAVFCATYALALFSACEKEALNPQNFPADNIPNQTTQVTPGETLLSHVDLGSDGYLDFTRFPDGELLVAGVVRSTQVLPQGETLNPVELYEYLKKEKAPEALAEAYRKAEENHTEATLQIKDVVKDAAGEDAPMMSATDFQNSYCSAGWDYLYCWVNRTGTSYVQNWKFSMHANSSPYRGTIRHRLRYKSWGTWKVVRDFVVLQNQVSYIYSTGSWKTRESKVFEADGDGYHHAIRGTN